MAGGHYVTIDEEMEVLRDKVIEAAKAWCNEVAEEMEWMKNNPNPNVRVNLFLLRMYLTTKALLAAGQEKP